MTYFWDAWAWLSGLSFLTKVTGAMAPLAGLAFLNPVMSILGVIWATIKTVLGWVFEGLENIVAHPVTFSVLVLTLLGGMWLQYDLDKHWVESYKIEAQNIAKKVKGAEDVEVQKAKAAIAARDAAKEAARALPLFEPNVSISPLASSVESAPPIALDTKPDSVRPGNTNHRRPKCAALFCP